MEKNEKKILSVSNLTKIFSISKQKSKNDLKEINFEKKKGERVLAVNNVSFEVEEGEIFGFLGPNGAGKTTTIRMLTGILKPTSGSIYLNGHDMLKSPLVTKEFIGTVPDMANVYTDLTGLENLILVGEIFGLSKKQAKDSAIELLKIFQLYEKGNVKAKTYSRGMKQRLSLGMTLMGHPKVLFLDEPTAGLDVQSSIIILDLLKEYNRQGMTIFLTTHDMELAQKLCDRIAIIKKGQIICLDTPENLQKTLNEYNAIECIIEGKFSIEELKKLDTIEDITQIDNHYHIIVNNIQRGIIELMDFITEKELKLITLSTFFPKFEDVFVKIIEGGIKN